LKQALRAGGASATAADGRHHVKQKRVYETPFLLYFFKEHLAVNE
jgi:hypothetical protein